MPRGNRVDPWGDLHAVSARGLFTGNRGCIVDECEQVVRRLAATDMSLDATNCDLLDVELA